VFVLVLESLVLVLETVLEKSLFFPFSLRARTSQASSSLSNFAHP